MIWGVIDHFSGATKRTRPAESIFAIGFERKLVFLGQILTQSIGSWRVPAHTLKNREPREDPFEARNSRKEAATAGLG